jgi:hypothetical protein
MSTIVTRSGKGSPLSHVEVDANFTNLNTDKIQSGNTVAALTITALTTPSVQAGSSAGLALKNSAGTTQISMGGGGGDNVTIAVATNINGANAQIDISPTGTGHVHIKPTGTGSLEIAPTNVGTINNMSIGATTASTGAFTSLTDSGNLTFTGTGNRITGDFSNATIANRVSFQNSTANSATVVNILPSGTGTASGIVAYNNSDPTNSAYIRLFNTGTEGAVQSAINGTGTYLPLTMYTGGSERLRIDTSGNVGIGTSSPNSTSGFTTLTLNNASSGGIIDMLSNGTTVGRIFNNSTSFHVYNQTANPLLFGTSGTERMRIDSSGNLLIGTTSTAPRDFTSGGGCAIKPPSGTFEFATSDANCVFFNYTGSASGSATFVNFRQQGVDRGSISTNGTITIYNTTSDYRLKNVVGDISDAGTRIDALEPIEYDWNTGGRTRGFLAHKFAEVYPNSVSGEKDAVNEEGKPIYQGMQPSTPEVMADLIAEIQSLRKRVALLESK